MALTMNQLVVGMFGAPAGNLLAGLQFAYGDDISSAAADFAANDLLPYDSVSELVDALLDGSGVDPVASGARAWAETQTDFAAAAVTAIEFLLTTDNADFAPAKALFENKVAVAEYYSTGDTMVTFTDVATSQALLASITPDAASAEALMNSAPTLAAIDALTVAEDGSVSFTPVAADADTDDTLTATASAENGTVTENEDGSWTYAPNTNFNGEDTITVTVTDAAGATATQTATVTVTAVNDAPTAEAAQAVTTDEDVAVTVDAGFADLDGEALTYAIDTAATNGTVVDNGDGTFAYTGNANFNGEDSFVVSATDAAGVAAQQTVTVTVNAVSDAPVITDAETDTVAMTGDANAVVTAATVSIADAEGNWENGTITVSVEDGFFLGDVGTDAEGLTIAGAAAANGWTFSTAATSIIATDGTDTVVVGTISNGGATTDDDNEAVFTSGTVTLTGAATDAIVSDLLEKIRVDGVQTSADAYSEATITITVTDGAGQSASFNRLGDSDGASAIAGLNDDREVEAATITAGVAIDDGGNAAFTNNGLDLNGATLTITSSVAGDSIDLTAAGGYSIISGQLFDGTDLIGAISNNETSSVTLALNAAADVANIDDIMQAVTVTGTALGAHDITTTLTESSGDSSLTDTTTLTVVGDFGGITGIGLNAAVAAGTSAAPVELATLLDVASTDDAITLSQNIYVNIGNDNYAGTASQDIQEQIDAGFLIVGDGVEYVRLVTDAASTTLDSVLNLDALGTNLVWHDIGHALEVNVAQADGASIDTTANITVTDLENNLAADLSGITSTGGAEAAAIDSDGGVTFTGDLGNFALTVTDSNGGTDDLTIAATLADGKTIGTNGNESVIITGVDASFDGDLGGVTSTGADVVINFTENTTLHADAQIDSASLAATVAQNATLTLSTAQAEAVVDAGGTITGADTSGNGNTGGSFVVTVTDEDGDATNAVTVTNMDLSGLTAGGNGAGATATTAGSVSMTVSSDTTFTGTYNDGTATVTVAAGATMTDGETGGTLAFTGQSIVGAGNVAITDIGSDLDADLTGILNSGTQTANVATTGTFTGDFSTFDVAVAENVTLTTTAAKVDGLTVTGNATTEDAGADTGGSIALTALGAAAVDLSGVTAGAASEVGDTAGSVTVTTVDVNAGITLDADTNLGTAALVIDDTTAGTGTLTLSAAQASGRSITDDSNESVVITALTSDVDLSDLDLGGTGSTTIQSTDESSVDISSNDNFLATDFGNAGLTIALTDTALTATAAQLDGVTVTGTDGADADADNESTVTITGGVAAATGGNTSYDITGLHDSSVDLVIADGFTVSNFVETDGTVRTATLTADSTHLSGQSVSGTGAVVATAFDATGSGDFSGITTSTAQLQLTADAVLSSNVTLGSATIVLDSDADAAGSADDSLTVTAAQAASLNVVDGGGIDTSNVTITGTVGADTMDYSSKDWDVDTLTINALTGDNVVTGAADVGSNVITTMGGNDTITAGTNADVLTGGAGNDAFVVEVGSDTAAVTIADFATGTDFLDLAFVVGAYQEAADADLGNGGLAAAVAAADILFAGDGVANNVAFVGDTDAADGAGAEEVGYLLVDTDGDDATDFAVILTGLQAADFAVTDII
jgi:hypothetical protein